MKRPGKTLRAVHPNAGVTAAYRRRLVRLVEEMAASYEHWIAAQYRAKPPAMAMDATPAEDLEREIRTLGKRWLRQFDRAAPRLAQWFLQSVRGRSERALMKILRDAGYSVKFTMTPEMRDASSAIVAENVGLIRSIGQQYHTQVEGMVMRSVAAGRDLQQLNRDLREQFGVSHRRARLIAMTQNNMATASLTRIRHQELGIEEALWMHSHGGKKPRRTHLANHGKAYKIAEGWYDPDPKVRKHIWPGQLIHCRCVSKPIVKGFS